MTDNPLNDIRDLLQKLPPPSEAASADMRARLSDAGAFEQISPAALQADWMAVWTGRSRPAQRKPLVAIFAGAHGIASHGVSASPFNATQDAVDACATGKSAISKLCLEADLGLKIFDLALDMPTADFTVSPALDERNCAATIAFGMEALADGTDILCVGAYGVGGSTSARAVLAALHPGDHAGWLPAPSNLVAERRSVAVETALATHRAHLSDPLEVLQRLGGREFAAILGAILAARFQSVPVVVDGVVGFAVCAALEKAKSGATSHCMLAAPLPTDRLNAAALEIGMPPILAQSVGAIIRDPLDGAFALQRLRSLAAVVS